MGFSPELLKRFTDKTEELITPEDDIKDVFHVYEMTGSDLTLYYDMGEEHLLVCHKYN